MFSIYCSAFNIENGLFDWKDSLDRFSSWAEEVVVGTTSDSNDNTIKLLQEYAAQKLNVKIVVTDFSLKSPDFDGNIKNAALQATTQPAKILLDLDEFIPLSQKQLWINIFNKIMTLGFDGCLIPSINLCGDIHHYKDIGYKFYLHRAGLYRGIFKEAKREDGSIDIRRSDTTELIDGDGNIVHCAILDNGINSLKSGSTPYVFHKWAVDLEKRINQNKFWKPVWENRARREVNNIILNSDAIRKIETFEHNLLLE